MPISHDCYDDVTPTEGHNAGTHMTWQITYYSDAAKTTEVDPTTVVASFTNGAGATSAPTVTNPSVGVYNVVAQLASGENVLKWTATDASGNDLVVYFVITTCD